MAPTEQNLLYKALKEFQDNPSFEEAIVYSLPYGETHRLELIQNRIIEMIEYVNT